MADPGLLLYHNPLDKNRLLAAFNVTTAALANAGQTGQVVNYNIKLVPTFNTNISSGSPVLILPGRKIQKAEVMGPTVYNQEQDILTLNRVQAVWSIYGGIVADTDQAEQLTLN